jgi:hypothetical protein
MKKLITIADMMGTAVFLCFFTPAFVIMSLAFIPLAMTLRLIRWCRERGWA